MIEVTRLGLAQSVKKQPQFTYTVSSLKYDRCEDATGLELSFITPGINVDRLKMEIGDAINNKHEQIRSFCQSQTGKWNVVLIVSSGRDYFTMKRYENKEYEITPTKDFLLALEQLHSVDTFVNHIVITRGKSLKKAIIFPSW